VLEGLEDRCLLSNTVIHFDDYQDGTVLTDQYSGKGVDFIGPDQPVVTNVGSSQANSGTNVVIVAPPPGTEFYPVHLRGVFTTSSHSFVQVAVGEPTYQGTEQIALYAYDSSGNLVAQSQTATVTGGNGFHSIISVTTSSSNIASFMVASPRATGYDAGKSLGIDDLTYNNPVVPPQPDFTIHPAATGTIELYQARSVTDTIAIQRINGSTGVITFAASGLPAGVTASFSPAATTSGNLVNLVLTASPAAATSFATITVTATPGSSAGTIAHSLQQYLDVRILPQITGMSPNTGNVPMALKPGTDVTITGAGFDVGMQVEFGNPYAIAYPSFDQSGMIHVTVPRLATDGPLTLIAPYDGVTSVNPGLVFHVNSFRNVDGYSFPNFKSSGYTYADLVTLFGQQAVYQTTASGAQVPTSLATAYLNMINGFPLGGQCFGMSLSSERFVEGRESYSNSPNQQGLTAQTVWDLAGGPGSALEQYVHQQQILTFSSENETETLLSHAETVANGYQGIESAIKAAFSQGNYPIVSMFVPVAQSNGKQASTGHSVVAYNLEDDGTGTGGFYIDVYDNNVPFASQENSNGALHQLHVGYYDATGDHGSRIHVYANGTWSFPNLSWSSKVLNLYVARPLQIPVQPTMSLNTGFSVTLQPGAAAQVAQITDAAGHTLFNPDGTLNTNPATMTADALMLVPLDAATPAVPYYVLGGSTGPYTVTMRGTNSGTYGFTLLNGQFAASFQAIATAQGQQDTVSIDPGGSVQFATTAASKALTVQLIGHATDGSEHCAVLTTRTASGSTERLGFDAKGRAFTYAHAGATTNYRLALEGYDTKGRAVTLVTASLRLKPGETGNFQALDWTRLKTKGVQLTVTQKNGRHQYFLLKSNRAPVRLARPIVRIHY
jgi:hypothetical protein